MKVLLQRVTEASVRVGDETVGSIGTGLLALVGVASGDDVENARACAHKVATLRLFEDEQGRMNRDVTQAGGSVLVVSQFTLLASTRKGRRPSFSKAAPPEDAEPLVERFRTELEARGVPAATGAFGARMRVSLVNDGPVTLWVEG